MKHLSTCILALVLWSFANQSAAQAPPMGCYVVDPAGDSILPFKVIQNLKELKPMFGKFKIISFDYYIAPNGSKHEITGINNGAIFQEELVKALTQLRPKSIIAFDNIKATNQQGITIGLKPLVLHAD